MTPGAMEAYIELGAELDRTQAKLEQAIDALREISRTEGSSQHKQRLACAALVNLGEQP